MLRSYCLNFKIRGYPLGVSMYYNEILLEDCFYIYIGIEKSPDLFSFPLFRYVSKLGIWLSAWTDRCQFRGEVHRWEVARGRQP